MEIVQRANKLREAILATILYFTVTLDMHMARIRSWNIDASNAR